MSRARDALDRARAAITAGDSVAAELQVGEASEWLAGAMIELALTIEPLEGDEER